MENFREMIYRMRYFMSLFMLFGFAEIGEIQGQCSALDVTVKIRGITSICQDGAIARIEFNNTSNVFFIPGFFTVTSDPSGNDFVTLENIVSSTGFTYIGGAGTGTMIMQAPSFAPQTVSFLEIELGFSCDLWDNLDQLEDYVVNVIGFNPNNTCFDATSDPFDVGYATVEPDPVNPPLITTDLGVPFDASIDLLVTNEWPSCDQSFILYAEFDPCIDYSNATVWLTDTGYCLQSVYQVFNVTEIQPGLVEVEIDLTDCAFPPVFPLSKRPCLSANPGNFNGAYGDLNVEFRGLVKTCCGDGGSSRIAYSTTTCDSNSPASCMTGNLVSRQFTSGVQTVYTPSGGIPNLTITESSEKGIKICANNLAFEIEFEVCNNSGSAAYDIDLSFLNGYGLNINNASVTYDGVETFLPLTGVDPGYNLHPVGGINDINMDGINGELAAGGDCFTFWLSLSYEEEDACLFEGLSCPANFHRRPYTFNVRYNNQCETLVPNAISTSNAPYNDLSMNTAYIDPQLGSLPEILEENTVYDLGLCVGAIDQSGWTGISDHGELNQCVTISSNYPNVTYTSLTGSFGTIPASGPNGNNFALPPGVIFDLECGMIEFEFSCDGAPEEPIHFDVEIKAFWDDCPDCGLVLACPEIDLFTECGDCPNPPCPGCEEASIKGGIINSTVEGLTTTEGEHRAYPCDDVRMEASANMNQNFSGPLSGCYMYQDDIPDVFTGGIAELRINNVQVAITGLSSTTTGNGLKIWEYDFSGTWNLTVGDQVDVFIYVEVVTDPLNGFWQNLDLYGVGIGFDESLCKVTDEFTVLDFEVIPHVQPGGSCCNGLTRTYWLEYFGGGFGDDFPAPTLGGTNLVRPLGEYIGAFSATVDMGMITDVVDFTNGTNSLGLSGTTVNWNANLLAPPMDKLAFNATIQSFQIQYLPSCGPPGVTIDVTGKWESGTYSDTGSGSACIVETDIADSHTHNPIQPDVLTSFVQDNIVEHASSTTLTASTIVYNTTACNPWIQLEFDPTEVDITYNGGLNTVTTPINPTKSVIAVQLPSIAVGDPNVFTDFDVEFINACDGAITVDLYGTHFCAGGAFPMPAVCSTDLDCEDSMDQATINILPSEVIFEGYDCDPEANECEIHYFSFTLKNQEPGDSENVGLVADLPPGFSVVEAFFDYPYSGTVTNCDLGTAVPASELGDFENGGWLIDTDPVWGEGPGFLPGQSHANSTEAQRTFHIVLGIIGGCDVDENDLLASFEAIGNLNCGDPIDLDPFEAELNVENAFVIPEVEINVTTNIYCVGGFGFLTVNIDFVDDNLDVHPDQIFKLSISGGVGYNLLCLAPIEFPYGDTSFTCQVQLTSSSCNYRAYQGHVVLTTCLTKECNGETCETETATLVDEDFYFHPGYQQVYINDITFDEEFCDDDSDVNSQITVSISTNNVDFGTTAVFGLFCDTNGNCRRDFGEPLLETVNVSLPFTSQFSFTMTPAEFHAACGSGSVIVSLISTNNDCLCVRDYCGELCCPCPHWDVTFQVNNDNNTICFDIVESTGLPITPDCVEFYPDGQGPASTPFSPWCFGLPPGTEEVCIVIYSDAIYGDGCDTLKTEVTLGSDVRGSNGDVRGEGGSTTAVWCEGECEEEWCANLNECQLVIGMNSSQEETSPGIYTFHASANIWVNNGTNTTYGWTLDGNPVSTDPSISIPNLPAGEYEICLEVQSITESGEVCNERVCGIFEVGIKALYTCENFFANYLYKIDGRTVYFVDASKGPAKVLTTEWEINGRVYSTRPEFTDEFEDGTYRVKLTVTYDMKGTICTKSISKWIVIGGKGDRRSREVVSSDVISSDVSVESFVFPNPHLGTTNLTINADVDAELSLTLYGKYGNLVWKENVTVKDGSMNKPLDMQGYAPGIYLLVINGEDYYQTHRVILSQ